MSQVGTAAVPMPNYDDDVVRKFFGATVLWGAVGMLVGVIIALQIAWWPANLGLPWTTFGRLRPLHTNAVIFAFGGNICFTGIYYSMQRLLKVRMYSDLLSLIHHRGGGHHAPLGYDPVQGVCGADLAHRHCHRGGVGNFRSELLQHHRHP